MTLRGIVSSVLGMHDGPVDELSVYPHIRPGLEAPEFEVYFRRGASSPIPWQTLLADTWIVVEGRRLQWLSYPQKRPEMIQKGQAVSWRVSLAHNFLGFDPESYRGAEEDRRDLLREGVRDIAFYVAGLRTQAMRFCWSREG